MAGLFLDSVQFADSLQSFTCFAQALKTFYLTFNAGGLYYIEKFTAYVGPTACMNNSFTTIQEIVAGVTVRLYATTIIAQDI